MKNFGVTLLEIVLVMTIIGIIIVISGMQLQGWRTNYKVESEVRNLYINLANARTRAMAVSRWHFATCTTPYMSYYIFDDNYPSPNGNQQLDNGTPGDTQLSLTTVIYPLIWGALPAGSPQGLGQIAFHADGTITTTAGPASPPWVVMVQQPSGMSPPVYNPDYDCIVLAQTRLNLGKWDGANCNAK